MTKPEEQLARIVKQLQSDNLVKELILRGYGEITIKIQDSKFILIEHNFKTRPQEN